MKKGYTDERNAQIIISLMKEHGIKKVVASPGATNICFVASVQYDSYFEVYSAPDERSAAYIACGMAAESGEIVALSCTGATSSRNYMPALTEAYYRKLPILVITSSRKSYRIGHNHDQVTDRRLLPRDVAKMSVQMPLVYDYESEWYCVVQANKAILELNHHGKGPVHINLETNYSKVYVKQEIPTARKINRILPNDKFPDITKFKKIAIMVGAHAEWNKKEQKAIDEFCEKYNGVVLCDHASNYKGNWRVLPNLMSQQHYYKSIVTTADLVIHLGEISASNYGINMKEVWRVNVDGELKDTYGKLTNVFEMEEQVFFGYYGKIKEKKYNSFFIECKEEKENIIKKLPDIPFSNAWIASQTAHKLPKNSSLHCGILNSLRTWNYFEIPSTCSEFANTGGFGIDGSLSTVIGASLVSPEKKFFCVLGDLAFFYDLNSLGNRHIGSNLRILLINNGKGTEFKLSGSQGKQFEEDCDEFIAAARHYGNQSKTLVKHFATDLGFEYYSASNKEEYLELLPNIVDEKNHNTSMIVEIFTNSEDEDDAINTLCQIEKNNKLVIKKGAEQVVKDILKPEGVKKIRKLLNK